MVLAALETLSEDQQREVIMARITNIPREVATIIVGYMGQNRELGAIMIGHRATGKTTLFHQLIFQCGGTDSGLYRQWASKEEQKLLSGNPNRKKTLPSVREYRKPAQQHDAAQFEFSPAQTNTHTIRLWDCDGDPKYYKNFVSCVGRASVGVLAIPATDADFEAATHAVTGWMREHLILLFARGVRRLVVAINKLDDAKYSETTYVQRISDIELLLRKAGFTKPENICYVPCVALTGENISSGFDASRGMGWYKGPTLFRSLCQLVSDTPLPNMYRPLRFSVYETHFVPNYPNAKTGTVAVTGYIESGCLYPNQKLKLEPVPPAHLHKEAANATVNEMKLRPNQFLASVSSLRKGKDEYHFGYPGDYIGIGLAGNVSISDFRAVHSHAKTTGNSVVHMLSDADPEMDPCFEAESWMAQLITISLPDRMMPGYTPTFVCGNYYGPVVVSELISVIDRKTGQEITAAPKYLQRNQAALVRMRPATAQGSQRCVVEAYSLYPSLGAFAILDRNRVVAVGVIKEVQKRLTGGLQHKIVGSIESKQKTMIDTIARTVKNVKVSVSKQIALNTKQIMEAAKKHDADRKAMADAARLRIAAEQSLVLAAANAPIASAAAGDVKDVKSQAQAQAHAHANGGSPMFGSILGGLTPPASVTPVGGSPMMTPAAAALSTDDLTSSVKALSLGPVGGPALP